MKNVKRSIAIILSVLMLATVFPMNIFATNCVHSFTSEEYIFDAATKTHQCKCVNCDEYGPRENCNFLSGVTKNATCTENGKTTYMCLTCGGRYTENAPEATGHSWDNGTVTTPATCIAEGIKTIRCINSGCTATKTEAVPMVAHNFTAEVVEEEYLAAEANCMSAAKYYKSCATAGCGLSSETEEDEAKRVTFVDPNGAVNPQNHSKTPEDVDWTYEYTNNKDCTAGGKKYKKCECGVKLEGTETSFTNHVFEKHDEKPATCTEEGNTFGYSCENCSHKLGYETIPAAGHKSVVDDAVPATCTTAGKTAGAHCSVCRTILTVQTEVPALDHNWTISNKIPATCTEDGHSYGRICLRCEETDYTVYPAINHENMETKAAAPATCTKAGKYEYMSCPDCKKLFMYEKDENGELVVDEEGNNVLKEITEAQTVEPVKGHDWDFEGTTYKAEYKPGKIPNCTTGGEGVVTCKVCQHKENLVVEPLGHKWAETGTYHDATCEKDGYTEYACTRDNCKATNEVSNADDKAFGHTWDKKYTVDIIATCYRQGEKSIHCLNKGCETRRFPEVISKTAHTLVQRTVPPTCTEEGATYQYCSVKECTYETTRTPIPATGHNYEKLSGERATCENDSTYIEKCTVCGNVNKDLSKKIGHVDSDKDGLCDHGCGKVLCTCLCHRTDGFGKFMYKIAVLIWDLLSIKQTCKCGVVHYTPTHM